jgi:tetratricopeptide (TPR) repeat protein
MCHLARIVAARFFSTMFCARSALALSGMVLLTAASSAAARDVNSFPSTADNLRRYQECMSLARQEPLRALPMAEKWKGQGGGLGARHCRAIAMFETGRHSEAATELEAIARDMGQERPGLRAELWAQAGQAWSAAGKADKAAAAQSRALELKSNDADLWVDRGLSYATLRQWPRAVSDFDHALALRPNNVEILILRSAAWRKSGDAGRALADAQLALKIAPDNTGALLERGFTFLARGDKVSAQADFNKVLSLVPPDSEAAKRAHAGLDGESEGTKASPSAIGRPAASGTKR